MKTFYDRAEEEIPAARIDAALAGASPTPYWLDDPSRPESLPPLRGPVTADLAVVGGGYTGLWTALLAKERDPDRSVVLLEGNRIGWAASGRNGGFCEASLTHGSANGQKHLPEETELLGKLGLQNLDEIEQTLARYGIDAGFERTGTLSVATEEHHVAWLREEAAEARRWSSWTGPPCSGRSPRRPTAPGYGTGTGRRWCTRPGWRGGCATPA